MIKIIITSTLAVMVFLTLIITGIILLVNKLRKKTKLKGYMAIVITSAFVFIGLIGLDIYFISDGIYKSREAIAEKSAEAADTAAQATGRGLVLTYDAIKKTWDERSVAKLKNIDITFLKSSEVIKGNIKTYKIDILLNNKNATSESMSISEMIEFNYLSLCDKDDIFYKVDNYKSESSLLPMGKSKATIFANVDKNVKLDYLKLVDRKISISN